MLSQAEGSAPGLSTIEEQAYRAKIDVWGSTHSRACLSRLVDPGPVSNPAGRRSIELNPPGNEHLSCCPVTGLVNQANLAQIRVHRGDQRA